MRRARRHVLFGLTAALCLACVSRMAAQLKEDMKGLSTSDLRLCLGSPIDVHAESLESELWTYRFPYVEHGREIEVQVSQGPGVPPLPPRVVSGKGLTDDESVRDTSTMGRRPAVVPRGTCLLFFQVTDRRVSGFDAAGRDDEGLNADERCALEVRYCALRNE